MKAEAGRERERDKPPVGGGGGGGAKEQVAKVGPHRRATGPSIRRALSDDESNNE